MNCLISQKHELNKYGDWVDSLENNYVAFFESFGINLLPVSNSAKSIEKYFDLFKVDGLILSGGNNVSPELYKDSSEVSDTSIIRDLIEQKLLKIALDRNLPVLGVCKGMQSINVYFGGSLLRMDTAPEIHHPAAVDHLISIDHPELDFKFGKGCRTNSYHNQFVKSAQLGSGLKTFATDDSGIIEGFYAEGLPLAAVQWHPERNAETSELDRYLMDAFVNRKLFWK